MNLVPQSICHRSTIELLRYRSKAKIAKLFSAFRDPRRQLLSLVAVILGFVWLSQAIASMLLRQSADPENLKVWIPLALLTYSLWHVVKIISKKPEEPFEWTPAENEYLRTAPITRTQLISYRLTSIFSAAVLKALCFSLVMIPDLKIWLFGFVGMLLGLVFVDLIRVTFELFFHGLSKTGQMICRTLVIGGLIGIVGWKLLECLYSSTAEAEIASPGSLLFFKGFVLSLYGLASTSVGQALMLPFRAFSELILTARPGFQTLIFAFTGLGLVGGLASSIYFVDRWMLRRRKVREKKDYQRGLATSLQVAAKQNQRRRRVSVPMRLNGFGSILWRQLLGAYHYRMTLVISLGLPIFLCCIPLLAKHSPLMMLINVVGGVVFYSFLLLPSALMLDFRRDISRMAVLKSLPITPLAMTLGQLSAPVLICSMFQWVVLLIAFSIGSILGWQAILAAFLLIPVNVLIFAIENFIFMMAPYRHNQEGVDVFLRTILTFTAKGILFAIALAVTVGWAMVAKTLGQTLASSPAVGPIIFGAGIWLFTCLVSSGFVYGLTRIYERFDPSQDLPAT